MGQPNNHNNSFFFRLNRFIKRKRKESKRDKISNRPRFKEEHTELFGKKFLYHDNLSFLNTYEEIFEKEIYKFNASKSKKTILDCGANMGLSVLFFARNYPDHTILAFEPDENIFRILTENVKTYDLKNVKLFKQAVWNKNETLEFYTDFGMGGRINDSYQDQVPQKIDAVRLKDFITNDIDFLKVDIEGAEYTVITDCRDVLGKVNNIFLEYHSHHQEPQQFHELLSILSENQFRYHLLESCSRQKPFIDKGLVCEIYDMTVNIFGYHQASHAIQQK
jgi:FkbM family methyltransferase